jgi:hypothetical protein
MYSQSEDQEWYDKYNLITIRLKVNFNYDLRWHNVESGLERFVAGGRKTP